MEMTRKTHTRLQFGRLPGISDLSLPLRAVPAKIPFADGQPRAFQMMNISLENTLWRWKVLRTTLISAIVPIRERIGAKTRRAPINVLVRPCPPRGQFFRV